MNEGHEMIEEQMLYPFLYNRFKISMRYLSSEHQEMHQGRDNVLRVIRDLETSVELDERRHLVEELAKVHAEYDIVLTTHLLEEEELIVPLMLSIPSVEFKKSFYGQ